ncbi:hypothetical protein Pdw03_2060 [Penicillium digitatum]|uniref:Uncharacterized protein n=1 Tax=Penicillium digitatum TaxID=36651 RepID=A0A7T6XU82_PENDI|nr:hypothetical protein Pdw03_2060 [Penicillium digitatum]
MLGGPDLDCLAAVGSPFVNRSALSIPLPISNIIRHGKQERRTFATYLARQRIPWNRFARTDSSLDMIRIHIPVEDGSIGTSSSEILATLCLTSQRCVPTGIAGPPRLTTNSEVATITYLQSKISLPIPKILDWNDNPSNPTGTEYNIQEHVAGVQLH